MWLRKTAPCLELLTVPGLPSSLKFSTDGTKLISGPQLALSAVSSPTLRGSPAMTD